MPPSRTSPYYQHILVHGLPRERGRQYGAQAADKIRQNVAHYRQPGQLPPWDKTLWYINTIYVPGLKQFFPTALDEMQGIADGAGISLEEIVMLNARYDLSRVPGGSCNPKAADAASIGSWEDVANECTSCAFWGASTGGAVLTAQNWDMSSHLYFDDLIVLLEIHPDPSENCPSMFLVTEAGQMGRSGMNSAGLGLTANSLNSSADCFPEGDNPPPMLPISLLRRLYLQETSFPKGLQAVYGAQRHVSNNLTLATAEGFGLCMELTPPQIFVLTPAATDAHMVHSNHFLSPAMAARTDMHDTYPGGSSWYRNVQLDHGVQPFLDGCVSPEILSKAFADHLGYPQSLCVHVDTSGGSGLPGYPFKKSMTVACVIYDLTHRVITVCKGPPCQSIFEKFKLDS